MERETCAVFSLNSEKVERVSTLLEKEKVSEVANIFKALSDETRLKVACTLLHEQELCVCDIATIIGATVATTSHHLRYLKNVGLAKSRKEGKLVIYSLDDDHVVTLIRTAISHGQEGKGNGGAHN